MRITDETKQIISAVKKLRRRVTQADVARATGLSLATVSHNLNEMAFESQGRLLVSPEGELKYEFRPGFQRYLNGRSLIAKVFGAIYASVDYAFKLSFGLMLLISMLSLTIVLMALEILVRALGSLGGGDAGGDFLSGALFVAVFQLIFTELPQDAGPEGKKSLSFPIACYYFVCGSGDPNLDLKERQWKLIADLIHRNEGVLLKEQLVPFAVSRKELDRIELEALVRFEGNPEVSESGNIIHSFPKMRHTAQEIETPAIGKADIQTESATPATSSDQSEGKTGLSGHSPGNTKNPGLETLDYLKERYWKFAGIGLGSTILVAFVAIVNLLGTFVLVRSLFRGHELFTALGIYTSFLFMYAIVFLLYPLARLGRNGVRNTLILLRNRKRQREALVCSQPKPALAEKLLEAKGFRIKLTKASEAETVFDTGKDSLEQQFELDSNR